MTAVAHSAPPRLWNVNVDIDRHQLIGINIKFRHVLRAKIDLMSKMLQVMVMRRHTRCQCPAAFFHPTANKCSRSGLQPIPLRKVQLTSKHHYGWHVHWNTITVIYHACKIYFWCCLCASCLLHEKKETVLTAHQLFELFVSFTTWMDG